MNDINNDIIAKQKALVKKFQDEKCQTSLKKLLYNFQHLITKTVNHYARIYRDLPLEKKDFNLLANYTFIELLKKYDESKGVGLHGYMKKWLPLNFHNIIRGYVTKSHIVMNQSKQIVENFERREESMEMTFSWEGNLNETTIERRYTEIMNSGLKFLSEIESIVIKQLRKGLDFEEIASNLKISIIKTRQAFQRAKVKIRKKLNRK